MATPTFLIPSDDDFAEMNGTWDAVLAREVNPPELTGTPVSDVLPYRLAHKVYELHVADCKQCGEGSFWDQCAYGDMLASRASDAVARQESLAVQN